MWVRSNMWQDERPVATSLDRSFWSFNFLTNLTTGNWKFSEFVQLQLVVQSFAIGFSLVLVIFSVQWTKPVNTRCPCPYPLGLFIIHLDISELIITTYTPVISQQHTMYLPYKCLVLLLVIGKYCVVGLQIFHPSFHKNKVFLEVKRLVIYWIGL